MSPMKFISTFLLIVISHLSFSQNDNISEIYKCLFRLENKRLTPKSGYNFIAPHNLFKMEIPPNWIIEKESRVGQEFVFISSKKSSELFTITTEFPLSNLNIDKEFSILINSIAKPNIFLSSWVLNVNELSFWNMIVIKNFDSLQIIDFNCFIFIESKMTLVQLAYTTPLKDFDCLRFESVLSMVYGLTLLSD